MNNLVKFCSVLAEQYTALYVSDPETYAMGESALHAAGTSRKNGYGPEEARRQQRRRRYQACLQGTGHQVHLQRYSGVSSLTGVLIRAAIAELK